MLPRRILPIIPLFALTAWAVADPLDDPAYCRQQAAEMRQAAARNRALAAKGVQSSTYLAAAQAEEDAARKYDAAAERAEARQRDQAANNRNGGGTPSDGPLFSNPRRARSAPAPRNAERSSGDDARPDRRSRRNDDDRDAWQADRSAPAGPDVAPVDDRSSGSFNPDVHTDPTAEQSPDRGDGADGSDGAARYRRAGGGGPEPEPEAPAAPITLEEADRQSRPPVEVGTETLPPSTAAPLDDGSASAPGDDGAGVGGPASSTTASAPQTLGELSPDQQAVLVEAIKDYQSQGSRRRETPDPGNQSTVTRTAPDPAPSQAGPEVVWDRDRQEYRTRDRGPAPVITYRNPDGTTYSGIPVEAIDPHANDGPTYTTTGRGTGSSPPAGGEATPRVYWDKERQEYRTRDGSPLPIITYRNKDGTTYSGIPVEAIDPHVNDGPTYAPNNRRPSPNNPPPQGPTARQRQDNSDVERSLQKIIKDARQRRGASQGQSVPNTQPPPQPQPGTGSAPYFSIPTDDDDN